MGGSGGGRAGERELVRWRSRLRSKIALWPPTTDRPLAQKTAPLYLRAGLDTATSTRATAAAACHAGFPHLTNEKTIAWVPSCPNESCDNCGKIIGKFKERCLMAANVRPFTRKCVLCGATEFSMCSDCFIPWTKAFIPKVAEPEGAAMDLKKGEHFCTRCIYDCECGLDDIESLLDHGSRQQIAKATAYMDQHGTAPPSIMAQAVISIPSGIDTKEKP